MPTDITLPQSGARQHSPWRRAGSLVLVTSLALVLVACASAPVPRPEEIPAPPPVVAPAPTPLTETTPEPVVEEPAPAVAPVPAAPVVANQLIAPHTTDLPALLDHAERLRSLTAPELLAHILALGDPGHQPVRQMQLALALTYTHQPPDTARALGLLQRVINHTAPESAPFKSLARILASRLMDQRRLEDAVDRQAQQLRDSTRRIEQLNERLEAMRAIERSLMPRPAAPGPNGNRSGPP
jgi:hypothetical protein